MRRTVIEEAIKRGKFGEDVWNAEQDKISELWHKIKSLRYSEHFDMNEKCQVDKDIIDNIAYDYEDEEEVCEANEEKNEAYDNIHKIRASYLRWKTEELEPMIVTTRKRISNSLICHGYTEDACMIVHQESRFVNAAVFDYWAETILFPEISRRRVQYNYKGEVLLLLDGCTSHFSDFFLDECTYFNVFPFQEPAGTSDQVQLLDLGIFGVQKTYKRSCSPPSNLQQDEKEIIALVDSWIRATTPGNVTSAFRQAGMYQDKVGDKYVMRADIQYARAVRSMTHEPAPFPEESVKTTLLKAF